MSWHTSRFTPQMLWHGQTESVIGHQVRLQIVRILFPEPHESGLDSDCRYLLGKASARSKVLRIVPNAPP